MPGVAKTHAFGLNTNFKIITSVKHASTRAVLKHIFTIVSRRKYSSCFSIWRMGKCIVNASLVHERGMAH